MLSRRVNFIIFDDLNRFFDRFVITPSNENGITATETDEESNYEVVPKFDILLSGDGYSLSVFHNILMSSVNFRKLVTSNLLKALKYDSSERDIDVRFQLVRPRAEVLDYGWNKRLVTLIVERHELENAMSWLSTLGGAFSALGDSIEHCAKVAGKISVQQLHIALRLGEPPLAARCKLYMALSLIQQRQLKVAKKIVEQQYEVAKQFKDFKLINMCKGIWARLQYAHKLERLHKNQ